MNRILIEPAELSSDGTTRLADERARHILTVLQAQPGDLLRIGLVNGPTGVGLLEAAAADAVRLHCAWDAPQPEEVPALDLLLAVPRPKVLKRLWAPLASLGVRSILLTNAAKVERNYFDTHWLEPAHYRPLLLEGLQQAGLTHLPAVSVFRRFRPLVEDSLHTLSPDSVRLLAHPGDHPRLRDLSLPTGPRVLLAIGPEGGWDPYELQLLKEHGFTCFSLGRLTLRTDVACIALLSLLRETLRLP